LALDGEVSAAQLEELRRGPLRGVQTLLDGGVALHGASIVFGENALAIVGGLGRGKSTLASACVEAGATLLSDGCVCVDAERRVRAGVSFIKMRAASLRLKGLDPESFEPLYADSDKRKFPAPTPPGSALFQLSGVVVLQLGEALEIHTPRPAERLALLMAHAYLVRAFPGHLQPTLLSRITKLSYGLKVIRVVRSACYDELPTLVRVVEELASESQSART
jgi:hypothetical protein